MREGKKENENERKDNERGPATSGSSRCEWCFPPVEAAAVSGVLPPVEIAALTIPPTLKLRPLCGVM